MGVFMKQTQCKGKKFGAFINSIVVFILLYFSSSYYALIINTNGVRNIAIQLIAVIFCFAGIILPNTKIIVQKSFLPAVIVFLFFPIIDIVFRGYSERQIVVVAVCVTALMLVLALDFKTFMETYSKVMFFLALFSIVCFFIGIIAPAVINAFPYIGYRGGLDLHNCFFSVGTTGAIQFQRNYSIFWEPGANQTFLIIALFYEIFGQTKEPSIKRILFFSFAIMTTVSITGYLAMILLFFAATGKNTKKELPLSTRKITIMRVSLVLFLIVVVLFVPDTTRTNLLTKISIFINPSLSTGSAAAASATARYIAVIIPFKYFVHNPVAGIGLNAFDAVNINECGSLATCTQINWLTAYGVVWAGLLLVGFYKLSKRYTTGVSAIVVFVAFMITIFSESYITSIIVYAISLYAYKDFDLV